jgi:spore coat polysaccharide biosynthesis protein SpsF (cytidylyltransferase family)
MKNVAICIQARSNNTRLPGKCLADINGMPMLDRVLMAAEKSASYINNGEDKNIKVSTYLLVPEGDILIERYQHRLKTKLLTGSETDVLSRYMVAVNTVKPDYIVRITSDCPLIPPFLITKHIVNAVNYNYDYVSNVHPEVRMAPDGWDCEVISQALMKWADETATSQSDREHVTTIIRSQPPGWAKRACVLSHGEFSTLKISVDTEQDLEYVRDYHRVISQKIDKARDKNICDGFFIL